MKHSPKSQKVPPPDRKSEQDGIHAQREKAVQERPKRSPKSYADSPGRPPDAVIDERVAEMVGIISARANIQRCQLHKLFCPKWRVHWKTVDRILGRARDVLVERLNRSRSEWRCDVMAAYERELHSDKPSVRLAALSGIRELLGLDEPRRTEMSGPMGGKIQLEQSVKQPIDYKLVGELARGLFGVPGKNGDSEPLHPAHADTQASPVPRRNGD